MSQEDAIVRAESIAKECTRVLLRAKELDAIAVLRGFQEAEAALASAYRELEEGMSTLKKLDEGAKTIVSLGEAAERIVSVITKAKAAIGVIAAFAT